jgi:hypothetical protein
LARALHAGWHQKDEFNVMSLRSFAKVGGALIHSYGNFSNYLPSNALPLSITQVYFTSISKRFIF